MNVIDYTIESRREKTNEIYPLCALNKNWLLTDLLSFIIETEKENKEAKRDPFPFYYVLPV